MATAQGKNYIGGLKNKGKTSNLPSKRSSKLTKDGLVYKNNLLDTDSTSQISVRKKLKGV